MEVLVRRRKVSEVNGKVWFQRGFPHCLRGRLIVPRVGRFSHLPSGAGGEGLSKNTGM